MKYAEAYVIRVKLGHAILVVRSKPTNGTIRLELFGIP